MLVSTDPVIVADQVQSTASSHVAHNSVYVHHTSELILESPIKVIKGAIVSSTSTVL